MNNQVSNQGVSEGTQGLINQAFGDAGAKATKPNTQTSNNAQQVNPKENVIDANQSATDGLQPLGKDPLNPNVDGGGIPEETSKTLDDVFDSSKIQAKAENEAYKEVFKEKDKELKSAASYKDYITPDEKAQLDNLAANGDMDGYANLALKYNNKYSPQMGLGSIKSKVDEQVTAITAQEFVNYFNTKVDKPITVQKLFEVYNPQYVASALKDGTLSQAKVASALGLTVIKGKVINSPQGRQIQSQTNPSDVNSQLDTSQTNSGSYGRKIEKTTEGEWVSTNEIY